MICRERIDRICRFCSIYRRYSDHQHSPASLRENPQLQKNQKDWQSKSKMKVPMNLPPSCSNYSPPFLRLIDQTQLNIFLGSYNCICQYNFDLKLDLKWFALLKWSHTKSSFHHLSCPHIQSFIPAANILNILDNYSLQRCNATAANKAARHIVVSNLKCFGKWYISVTTLTEDILHHISVMTPAKLLASVHWLCHTQLPSGKKIEM